MGDFQFSTFERQLADALNRLRAEPRDFIPAVRELRKWMERDGTLRLPDRIPLATKEGDLALIDAIDALSRAKPVGPVRLSVGMTKAARDHCADLGPKGQLSHDGSDKSTPFLRLQRYGKWRVAAAENLAFGENKAEAVLLQMIIDDGAKERGHRKNLLNGEFNAIGVAIAKHSLFECVVVLDLAGEYEESAAPSDHVAAVPLDTAPPASLASRPGGPRSGGVPAAGLPSGPAPPPPKQAWGSAPPPPAPAPPTALLSNALARLGVQETVPPPKKEERSSASAPSAAPAARPAADADADSHSDLLANLARLRNKNYDEDEDDGRGGAAAAAAVPAPGPSAAARAAPPPASRAPPAPASASAPAPASSSPPPSIPSGDLPPPPPPAARFDARTGEPLCAGCGNALGHTVIKALDASWHKDCFCCASCRTGLAGGSVSQFYSQEGRPYCKPCYEDKFSPKCKGCAKPISGTYATALGGSWHPDCMRCSRCRGAIHGSSFYKDDAGGFLCTKCGNA
eukprot:tig00000113_g5586.t1